MMTKTTGKNGLVELFRFICSVWVAYFHGFFPVLSENFDGVNISIDFFFMVSGLFFLKSMEKYREKPFLEGFRHITLGKVQGFIVPLGVAALSVLACNIIFEFEFNKFNWPLSFLWFFVAQAVYLTLFYLIYRRMERRWVFNLVCVGLICLTMSFCLLNNETAGRVIRGLGMIALGALVSQIPKIRIRLKSEKAAQVMSTLINVTGFIASAAAFVYLAYLPTFEIGRLHLFICIVCPSLLYFATALPVRSRILSLLGEFSVFIYLAQCPILLHYYGGTRITTDYFGWLCFYAVLLFAINRMINKLNKSRRITA